MGKNPISASLFPFLTFYRPPCLPTPPNWSFFFIPRQMASNSRYPSWEPHEVVLDTPGLPELQGGVCVCKTMDQIDLYITQIPALMHRVAQSKWNAARGGVLGERGTASGRRKDGEKGRGADTRRADFSQILLHLRDKKGNNGFRWGKLQRDTYHPPLHCERRITESTERKKWEAALARIRGDVSKCTPDNLPQKCICIKSYWTLTLSYLSSHQHLFLHSEPILFTGRDNCNVSFQEDTDADTNWQFIEFLSKFWHSYHRANRPWGRRSV